MKKQKNTNVILISLFEIAVGILLLINPIGFSKAIIVGVGIVLLAAGIFNTIKYFRTEINLAATGQYLFKGLIALSIGAFCIFNRDSLANIINILTAVYGLIVLVAGLKKIQITADLLRRKSPKWFMALISAAISIVCAAIIIYNPFPGTNVIWIFIGITLIVESLVDIATAIMNNGEKKAEPKPEPKPEDAPKSEDETKPKEKDAPKADGDAEETK